MPRPMAKNADSTQYTKRVRVGICFCCRVTDAPENAGPLLSCGRKNCEVQFHESCFKTYDFGDFNAEMMADDVKGRKVPFCSRHYCACCYGNGYRTRAFYGKYVNCSQCELAWHTSCIPAGSEKDENGEIICPRHVNFTVAKHISHCHHCQTKDLTKGPLLACRSCVRSIHVQCASENSKDTAEELDILAKGGAFQCSWCTDFAFVWEGQPCMGFAIKSGLPFNYYPCTPVSNDLYPDRRDKKLGRPGYVAVRWFPWQGKYTFNLIPHSHIIEMNDSDFFFSTIKHSAKIDDSLKEEWFKAQQLLADPKSRLPREDQKPLKGQSPLEAKMIKHYVRWDETKEKFVKANVPSTDFLENCNSECHCPVAEKRCLQNCANRITAKECPASCHLKGHCNNRVIQEGQKCEFLEVFNSEHCGKGVRTTAVVYPDTFIDEYYGEIIDKVEVNKRQQKQCSFNNHESQYYIMHVQGNYYVDAAKAGGIARYVNHSCDPNCVIKRIECGETTRVALFSTRMIEAGEELTFNYSMLNVTNESGVLPACFCGAANCTGMLGGKGKNRKRQIESYDSKENEPKLDDLLTVSKPKKRRFSEVKILKQKVGNAHHKQNVLGISVKRVKEGSSRKKNKDLEGIANEPPVTADDMKTLCKEIPTVLKVMKEEEFTLSPAIC